MPEKPAGPFSDTEKANRLFDGHVRYENKERPVWQKVLGLEKVSRGDIAAQYAEKLDEFVDAETKANPGKETEEAALAKWHMLNAPAAAGEDFFRLHPKSFAETRDAWVEATKGRVSAETMNTWPEVQQTVRKELARKSEGYPHDISDFIQARDAWVKAGVITAEEANSLPEVRKHALSHVVRRVHYPYTFDTFIDERHKWVDAGVLTLDEINTNPAVQQAAQLDIQKKTSFPYNPEDLRTAIERWVEAGILSRATALAWSRWKGKRA